MKKTVLIVLTTALVGLGIYACDDDLDANFTDYSFDVKAFANSQDTTKYDTLKVLKGDDVPLTLYMQKNTNDELTYTVDYESNYKSHLTYLNEDNKTVVVEQKEPIQTLFSDNKFDLRYCSDEVGIHSIIFNISDEFYEQKVNYIVDVQDGVANEIKVVLNENWSEYGEIHNNTYSYTPQATVTTSSKLPEGVTLTVSFKSHLHLSMDNGYGKDNWSNGSITLKGGQDEGSFTGNAFVISQEDYRHVTKKTVSSSITNLEHRGDFGIRWITSNN